MEEQTIKHIVNIINDNKKWPIIFKGLSVKNFSSAVVLSSDISSAKLGVCVGNKGKEFPSWIMQCILKENKKERIIIFIDAIDEIDKEEQLKFVPLLKNKSVNGYTLPKESQIVLGCKDENNINQKVLALSLLYKVV